MLLTDALDGGILVLNCPRVDMVAGGDGSGKWSGGGAREVLRLSWFLI